MGGRYIHYRMEWFNGLKSLISMIKHLTKTTEYDFLRLEQLQCFILPKGKRLAETCMPLYNKQKWLSL